jgi:hypothetical protein
VAIIQAECPRRVHSQGIAAHSRKIERGACTPRAATPIACDAGERMALSYMLVGGRALDRRRILWGRLRGHRRTAGDIRDWCSNEPYGCVPDEDLNVVVGAPLQSGGCLACVSVRESSASLRFGCLQWADEQAVSIRTRGRACGGARARAARTIRKCGRSARAGDMILAKRSPQGTVRSADVIGRSPGTLVGENNFRIGFASVDPTRDG